MRGVLLFCAVLAACSRPRPRVPEVVDVHSYARPWEVRVRYMELDLRVDFAARRLAGAVMLELARRDEDAPLVLDTRDLKIESVEEQAGPKEEWSGAEFRLGERDAILGSSLTVPLRGRTRRVRIRYATTPGATALQWLEPAQTSGGKHPFLYTQSQAIHARSWIPLQDSPAVKMTYRARIRTPRELIALMSARQDFRLANRREAPTGDYTFRMPEEVPAYLIALAVGDLEFRYLGHRVGVWSEPAMADVAEKEFEDTERMLQVAEKLFGPYAWLRYDTLILPPSFPFGGMENPVMTFATPTILAGDKSLMSLIAHELAHSWAGNSATNATWGDFWLNEGFTTYAERRIIEAVYGVERARMEAQLGRQELEEELKSLKPGDQMLAVDLKGRDPDEAVTAVAYEKGALLLAAIEEAVGRERFDRALATWFRNFRFQSVTTGDFRRFVKRELGTTVDVEEWLTKPGIPASAPRVRAGAFDAVDAVAAAWRSGRGSRVDTRRWSTQEWLHFLRAVGDKADAALLARIDGAYTLSRRANAEIRFEWLRASIRTGYRPGLARLDEFLVGVGRRKFARPLYEELAKSEEGKRRAREIFAKAEAGYHPITRTSVAAVLR